ncbi:hypothetical protein F8M41_012036 [Gigaspora margarita]|uniref:Uncharacterized protein n=1 Tax=Gigaspora margarita TaxID=4874 RepID=A0A8H4A1A9_GIGMA|nr:hypothetical protein F8M41_012036 [Gigaspora margarita]
MDQENSFASRYESEDTSDNILEHNSAPIVPYEFSSPRSLEYFTSPNPEYSTSPSYTSDSIFTIPLESSSYNLEYVASSLNLEYVDSSPNLEYSISSLYTSKYSTSLYNSEESNLSLNDSENFTAINDIFDYPDSSNIPTLQNAKKYKLVFVTSSNKKPKPGKSWVWHHMKKDRQQ